MFWNRDRRSTWKGLAAGAIGGAVASFAMNQFQAGMSKLFEQPEQASGGGREGRQQREGARRGASSDERADIKAAVAVSETVFHHEIVPDEKEWAASLVHYAFGTAVGAVYGAAAEHWDEARAGQGTGFGAVLWAISDEVAVPAMGLSKGPRAYPIRTHAMALASHLVYGVTTELTRRALRQGVLSR